MKCFERSVYRKILYLAATVLMCLLYCFAFDDAYAAAAQKYLPIEYHTARFDQVDSKGNPAGTDYWYAVIPPKYKMHYAYARDMIFGREIHTSNAKRHGATLAVNTQFLGFPEINGEKVTEASTYVKGYDFFITQNPDPAAAYDVFNVYGTNDPTDTRIGMSFKDINLGFDYSGLHVPYAGPSPYITDDEIFMVMFTQVVMNGQTIPAQKVPDYLNARHPRTWLAYDSEGNQFVAVSAGRNVTLMDGTQRSQLGLNYSEMVEIAGEHLGYVKTLYNMDGGGSCSFVWKGNKLSPHYDVKNGVLVERSNYGTFYWKVEKRKVTAHHYLSGTSDKIADDEEQILDEGDRYETGPVSVPHYRLVETPRDAAGILEDNVEVDYYYAVEHDLVHTEGKAPTCTEAGSSEYWQCSICKKYFSDGKGEKEIHGSIPEEVPPAGHAWGEWTVVTPATHEDEGLEQRVCENDPSHKETRPIPKTDQAADPDSPLPDQQVPAPESGASDPESGASDPLAGQGTDAGSSSPAGQTPGAGSPSAIETDLFGNVILSAEEKEQQIVTLKNDYDTADSTFGLLQARTGKVTGNSITVKWKKVAGAAAYVIYGNQCGAGNRYLKIAAVSGTSYTQKKLKKGTYYKYLVVAVGSGKALATSKTIHAATSGGKYGNDKAVKVNKRKVSLKRKNSVKIRAAAVPQSGKLKVRRHRKISFETADPKVAVVTKDGKITAIGKGQCMIYAYAQNGVMKTIKVTVK